jgi:type IV secretion system protein VirB1
MKTMPCEHRQMTFLAALTVCVFYVPAFPASAAPISSGDFDALAAKCAASVPVATLAAVARTESGVDPWVLHDNTTGASIRPNSLADAQIDAGQLTGRGDSVDIGLMQINSANLPALGISATAALDPCISLAGGAALLRAAYGGGNTDAQQQVALLLALSRYNTGTPFKGIMNGYARTVEQNGLPDAALSPPSSDSTAANLSTAPTIDPNAPPGWNLWASAAYARSHGASWLVTSNSDPGQH